MSKIRYLPPLFLAVIAIVLLLVGFSMPAQTDPAGFEREMMALDARYGALEGSDTDPLTTAFFDSLDRHATARWVIVDLGYLALVWAVASTVIGAVGWGTLLRRSSVAGVVIVLYVAAMLLLGASMVMDPIYAYWRNELPWWADSIGIPISSTFAAMTILAPVFAVALLAPLLRRRAEAGSLIASDGLARPRWQAIAVALLYAPFLLTGAALLIWSWGRAGWANSLAGALIVWLSLNALSVWLAPGRSKLRES